MTGYQSKKAARQDSNGMTFADRCQVSEQCLPDTPYRAMLTKLHNEMLAALAQPAQEPSFWLNEQGQLHATRGDAERHSIGQKIIPLYTRPPQRTQDIHTCTPPQENT